MQKRLNSALDELKILQIALIEEKKKSTQPPILKVDTQSTTTIVQSHSPKKSSPLKVII